MKQILLNGAGRKGLLFQETAELVSLFGIPAEPNCPMPEGKGLFYLRTDRGRFETGRWETVRISQGENTLTVVQKTTCGSYRCETVFAVDPATGIVSRKDRLTNLLQTQATVYSCLPRMSLSGEDYEIYAQYSGWCEENRGGWMNLVAGDLVLTNSDGRSTENAAPFACIRSKQTGLGCAMHVVPMGDWMIRIRRLAGARTSFLVIELGLSDQDLHMTLQPGETLELPEVVLQGFEGQVESCAPDFQRYLLGRYPVNRLCQTVYNCWLYTFDELDQGKLRAQAEIAAKMGCKTFVVDAGWFGQGKQWENQVGNWVECTEAAFFGKMKAFADYVRSLGMSFGLWMEITRASAQAPVYKEHPDWFMEGDAIIYDLTRKEVRDHLCREAKRLVDTYGLVWMKIDYNLNMYRDRTGSNFYRYYQGEALLMEQLIRENPACSFQGCASGAMRADFNNAMKYYHGFDVSDTANPMETLRMRQGFALRMLPAYTSIWATLCEVPVSIGAYHNRSRSRMLLSGGDGWWHHAWELSADFMAKLSLLGETGFSGDLMTYSEETKAAFTRSIAFAEEHRSFLGRSVCHLLTPIKDMNDLTGWACFQQENIDGEGSLLYAYRLADDSPYMFLFPRNLQPEQKYRIVSYEGEEQILTGGEIAAVGIPARCDFIYSAAVFKITPL